MNYYDLQQTVAAVATASVIYVLYRRYNRPSLKDIPRPPNPSWVYGKLGDLVPVFVLLFIAILKDTNGTGRKGGPVPLKSTFWRTMEPWLVGMAPLGYAFTWSHADQCGVKYISHRRNACGPRTPRLSVTSSRTLTSFTESRIV
jgi:hypothetical protein